MVTNSINLSRQGSGRKQHPVAAYCTAASLCVEDRAPLARFDIQADDIIVCGVEVFMDRGPTFEVRIPQVVGFDDGHEDESNSSSQISRVILPARYLEAIKAEALSGLRTLLKG